jgi:Ca2+-binding RTX toxin-like protein
MNRQRVMVLCVVTALLVPAAPANAAGCGGRSVDIRGTGGANQLRGTPGPDVISGLGGNDIICGGRGRDFIFGGGGRDRLYGGPGRDVIYPMAGYDPVISGGHGYDVCDGSPREYRTGAWNCETFPES